MQKIVETDLGFIFRAENIKETFSLLEDIDSLRIWEHHGKLTNKTSFKSCFSNPQRFKTFFIYGFMNKKNKSTAIIIWQKGFDFSTKSKTLNEFIWASSEKSISLKLFKESLKDVDLQYKYDILISGNSEENEKLEKFYKRLNFKKANYFYKIITDQ